MATRRSNAKGGSPSAFQRLQDQLKWVDLVFEVRDARAPHASGHPRACELFAGKPRVIVLAKEDLADQAATTAWLKYFSGDAMAAIALSLKVSRGKEALVSKALHLTAHKRQALVKKGLLPRPVRACVVGMPNVGKSSLINWLVGRRKTLVGDRPGVTRGTQWVRLHNELELLDTPGILPNTQLPPAAAEMLAVLNLIPEGTYLPEEAAVAALRLVEVRYPGALAKHFGCAGVPDLAQVAQSRNLKAPGGKPDLYRASSLVLSAVREGKLGRLTLETP